MKPSLLCNNQATRNEKASGHRGLPLRSQSCTTILSVHWRPTDHMPTCLGSSVQSHGTCALSLTPEYALLLLRYRALTRLHAAMLIITILHASYQTASQRQPSHQIAPPLPTTLLATQSSFISLAKVSTGRPACGLQLANLACQKSVHTPSDSPENSRCPPPYAACGQAS